MGARSDRDGRELDSSMTRALAHAHTRMPIARLLIAFSGGCDSRVLLHLAVRCARAHKLELGVLHIDHALDDASARRAERCRAFCATYGLACEVVRLAAMPPVGASVEAWARTARYRELAQRCAESTLVMTAHHADDQAETVVQRVVLAAGPHGLGGIRALRPLGVGQLARPLLGWSRAELEHYARGAGLEWQHDPGNDDRRYLRNRVRHDLMPALTRAFPHSVFALGDFAALHSELAQGIDEWSDGVLGPPDHRLPLATLAAVPRGLRVYLVRRWLQRLGVEAPRRAQWRTIEREMYTVRGDACPQYTWGGVVLRRYRGSIYVLERDRLGPPVTAEWAWQAECAMTWPWAGLTSRWVRHGPRLERSALARGPLSLRLRRGGERLSLDGRSHRRTLKNLLQEWAVPPWERDRLALLFIGDALAAVPGYAVAAEFHAPAHELGLALDWQWRVYPTAPSATPTAYAS
jgi:tRNA(Ile)-lysidine synthase